MEKRFERYYNSMKLPPYFIQKDILRCEPSENFFITVY